MLTFCSARETVPKLREEVHLRFVTPASRRQSSQFLFAGGDAGATKSFGTVPRVSRPLELEFCPPEAGATKHLTFMCYRALD